MRCVLTAATGLLIGLILALASPHPLAQEQAHPFTVGSHCRFAPMLSSGMEPTVVETVGPWVRIEFRGPGGSRLDTQREPIWINTAQATVATCPPN